MKTLCWVAAIFPALQVRSLVVKLRFDGSFRPPRDPGYPTIPTKMAVSGASISFGGRNGIGSGLGSEDELIAIGCGWNELHHEMTSAHAEYQGMLLGLGYLLEDKQMQNLLSRNQRGNSLLIEGDCKSVIDQLNGKSIPRKLESLHTEANRILNSLRVNFKMVEVRHIPRLQNSFCDRLCGNLLSVIEWQQIQGFFTELAIAEEVFTPSSECTTKSESHLSAQYLFDCYFKQSNKCRIRFSARPVQYDAIADLCRSTGAFGTLLELGEHQATESHVLKDKYLLASGIRNQMDGWKGEGKEKKAASLARKHRALLTESSLIDRNELDNCHDFCRSPQLDWGNNMGEELQSLLRHFESVITEEYWKEDTTLWATRDGLKTIGDHWS